MSTSGISSGSFSQLATLLESAQQITTDFLKLGSDLKSGNLTQGTLIHPIGEGVGERLRIAPPLRGGLQRAVRLWSDSGNHDQPAGSGFDLGGERLQHQCHRLA
jgi:hypothetical protein